MTDKNDSRNVEVSGPPPINPTTDEEVGKPVFIAPPNSQDDELKKNVKKHADSLKTVFEEADPKKSK